MCLEREWPQFVCIDRLQQKNWKSNKNLEAMVRETKAQLPK
jgi:hypothetical protein